MFPLVRLFAVIMVVSMCHGTPVVTSGKSIQMQQLQPSQFQTFLCATGFENCISENMGSEFEEIKYICGADTKCLVSLSGTVGDMCSKACADYSNQVSSEDVTLSRPDVTLSRPDVTTSRFVKCMGECLGKDIADVEALFAECKFDVTCWEIKVGLKAIVCVAKCIKWKEETSNIVFRTAVSLSRPDVTLSRPDVTTSRFVKCMGECLGKSIADIEAWFAECKFDVTCWEKKVGFKAIECVAKCIKWKEEPSTFNQIESQSSMSRDYDNDFDKCFADCLRWSMANVVKWFAECQTDFECWLKVTGPDVIGCAAKCIKVPPVSSEVASLSVPEITSRSNFVKCMGKCLKKALPDIWKWFIECNVNVACWEIKAGVQAIGCVAKCIKEQDETSYFDRYV